MDHTAPTPDEHASPARNDEEDNDDFRFSAPETYDPEEYRWVPVKRRPRLDGWTEEKQRRFIEALADTGVVSAAAKEVGMTARGANKLRRSAHGAAFARAWDAARDHAGSVIEDVAFERAIEGVEHNVYNENGEVVCTKRVYNDRLLMFLLRHLKPERYARDALAKPAPPPAVTVEASLREMEPQLPAPAEELLDPDELENELLCAEIGDGKLAEFHSEQRPEKTEARLQAERWARGKAVSERRNGVIGAGPFAEGEFADMCFYLDPTSANDKGRKRYR